jgi:hypothetical protein
VGVGVGMTDDPAQRIAQYDGSGYDVIVFDEMYFASISILAKIERYNESNPNTHYPRRWRYQPARNHRFSVHVN